METLAAVELETKSNHVTLYNVGATIQESQTTTMSDDFMMTAN